MQVCQGEVTSQDVSTIVNPTNTQLSAEHGVSEAIASAAGPCFKQSCKDILAASGGKMSRGETAITVLPAGAAPHLKCQHIIHAVLPLRTGIHHD